MELGKKHEYRDMNLNPTIKRQKKEWVMLSALIMASLLSLLLTPWIGLQFIHPIQAYTQQDLNFVLTMIRIPRTLAAFLAGGGLALAGMVYQAIFRNPLADPYTLGVSSGASLGAALCIVLGFGGAVWSLSFVSVGALLGALLAMGLIYLLAWSGEHNSYTLLLAGVIVATVCSGIIMFLHLIGGLQLSFQILRWIMGGVDTVNYSLLIFLAIPIVLYAFVLWIYEPVLDHFLTGDLIAHSRGIHVDRFRLFFVFSTALAVGIIVSVCGPIGFVGILAPHTCRLIMPGIRHRMLGSCSFLFGGTFLVLTDTLARSLVPPAEIPVGIITALVGGPFFLMILFKRKKHGIL